MMNFTNNRALYFIFSIAIFCVLTLVAWPLLVHAGPDLPPRDPPPTTVPPPSGDEGNDDDDDGGAPLGAYIELQTRPVPVGVWATVQWRDSAGSWHNVEGWRSALAANGYQLWWVEAKDFGKGPFRWIVTQGVNGARLGSSMSFNLPNGANERVRVTVSVAAN